MEGQRHDATVVHGAGPISRAARRRRRRRVLGIALVAAALSALWLIRRAGTALVIDRAIDSPDVIVSLASHEWERLPDAALLARRAPQARVLLTQPIKVNAFNCHDCDHRVDRLVAAGVDRDRIELLPRRVYRTLDEAQAVREWAVEQGIRSIMVVTSPYHTSRALACFRHILAGTGIAVGVRPAAGSPAEPQRWWRHKYDRWYVSYEWRARLFYLIRFGVR